VHWRTASGIFGLATSWQPRAPIAHYFRFDMHSKKSVTFVSAFFKTGSGERDTTFAHRQVAITVANGKKRTSGQGAYNVEL
jgi:hypothetical protein